MPARQEGDCIRECLQRLFDQTRPPDRIIVTIDPSTDDTESIAKGLGVEVVRGPGCGSKAHNLNGVLGPLLPALSEGDAVLVQDADSYLDSGFVEHAVEKIEEGYAAVGGTFRGRVGGGYVGWLQSQEFCRYARDVRRLKGKALCLTGTATLFTVGALRNIVATREGGNVYDTDVLTEDFEISLALRHLRYRYVAPKGCTLSTEIMETWGDLYKQRLRWKRGAVENLIQYGLTRITLEHWARQALTLAGILVTTLYLTTLTYGLLLGGFTLYWPWIVLTLVFCVERTVTVWKRGVKHALLASILLTEAPYDLFLQGTHMVAYFQTLTNTKKEW